MGCSQSASKPVERPADATAAAAGAAPIKQTAATTTHTNGHATNGTNGVATAGASAPAAAGSAAAGSSSSPAPAVPASGQTTDAAEAKAIAQAAPAVSIADVHVSAVEQHRPLVVCGPSGVGKGTLLTRLLKEFPGSFAKSVSHTTRAPRAGEVNGVSYHFTSSDELLAQVGQGKFVEHAVVHGNYYGTSIASVATVMESGRLCLLEIDIQGVLAVRKVESLKPRCIFVRPAEFCHLADRLAARGSESAETTETRLDTARAEMDFFYTHRQIFDADLINDELEATYQKLLETIQRLYPTLKLVRAPAAAASASS